VALAFPVAWVAFHGPRRESARAAARLAPAGATLLAAMVPWWLFSRGAVGTVAQDSAVMKILWGRTQAGTGAHLFARVNDVVHGAVAGAVTLLSGDLSAWSATWEAAGLVLVTIAVLRVHGTSARRLRWLLGVLAGHVLLLLAAYGAGAADIQSWYLGLPGLVVFLAAMAALARLARRDRRGLLAGAAVLVVGVGLGVRFWSSPFIPFPWQRDVLATLPEFEAHIPSDARVGCFNAGIPAYFGTRTVVNLDGLVNHGVIPYWRQRRFQDYLRDAQITFVADEESALKRSRLFSSADPPLVPVASHPLTGWVGRRFLWRVGLGNP
jgi:hypothetical protein